jgi:hypothetical protein
MVLLDATADIDGVKELCPWRKQHTTPQEDYGNLEIAHVASVAKGGISAAAPAAKPTTMRTGLAG